MRSQSLVMAVLIMSVAAYGQTGRSMSTGQRVLTGIEWRLISLGPAGSETTAVAGTTVMLRFAEDNRASGSTGCNSFSGAYQVRGDNISFGRLVSTRRACLDQNANEQEQRFLSTLGAANRFRLTRGRLTILSDRGRTVLNFVNNSISEPQDGPRDDRNDPVRALAAYYSAINARDYRGAFGFWDSAPSSYEQFARGFGDTDQVRLLVDPSTRVEGAAGSVYADISAIVVSTMRNGGERVFAGCYVMRRSNVQDRGWQIYRADVSPVSANIRLSRILSQGCRN
ncbi:MAG TPA: META domain-containing protein [Pyrinomonadaceae bacterium]|nr:META domain-containing protein [Pyrinomonadaceae bacterium]